MCMKNLDTNVVFFTNADTPKEAPGSVMNVYGMSKGTPFVPVVPREEGLLGIQSLSFMLLRQCN